MNNLSVCLKVFTVVLSCRVLSTTWHFLSISIGLDYWWSPRSIKLCPIPHSLILQKAKEKKYKMISRGLKYYRLSSVQFSCSVVSDSLQPHGLEHARLPCPSPTPRIYSNMSIESVMLSNHLILCHPLLLLPSIFPSIRVFSRESVLHIRWSKYWSFRIQANLIKRFSKGSIDKS